MHMQALVQIPDGSKPPNSVVQCFKMGYARARGSPLRRHPVYYQSSTIPRSHSTVVLVVLLRVGPNTAVRHYCIATECRQAPLAPQGAATRYSGATRVLLFARQVLHPRSRSARGRGCGCRRAAKAEGPARGERHASLRATQIGAEWRRATLLRVSRSTHKSRGPVPSGTSKFRCSFGSLRTPRAPAHSGCAF
jgi:hypothetical protein